MGEKTHVHDVKSGKGLKKRREWEEEERFKDTEFVFFSDLAELLPVTDKSGS